MATPAKLTTEQVFDRMRPLMCQITSPIGISSGILITPSGYVLSVMHNIPQVVEGGRMISTLEKVQLIYNQKNIDPTFPESFIGENAYRLDLSILQTGIEIEAKDCIPILPEDFILKEGMKAYFAGFPLTQSSITFHKGTISSITEKDGVCRFTIDGTVVPGNSGGPVLIQHEGNLFLAGIILSEVADLDPDFLFVESSFEMMRKNGGVGGMALGIRYPDGKVRSTSPLDLIGIALTVIKRNMSTGVGRAIDARCLKKLFSGEVTQSPSTCDLLVKKPYSQQHHDGKIVIMKYMEHFPGNAYGKGPRGIRLTHHMIKGSVVYLFDVNPHDIRQYNKKQNELYDHAAVAFLGEYSKENTVPEKFTFTAYGEPFQATLQTD